MMSLSSRLILWMEDPAQAPLKNGHVLEAILKDLQHFEMVHGRQIQRLTAKVKASTFDELAYAKLMESHKQLALMRGRLDATCSAYGNRAVAAEKKLQRYYDLFGELP